MATAEKQADLIKDKAKPQPLADAVQLNGKAYVWELKSETVTYPIDVVQSGKTFTLYFQMKHYDAVMLKRILGKLKRSYKTGRKGTTIHAEDDLQYVPLFDEYFVQIFNTQEEGQIDKQKEFMDRHPKVKATVISEGPAGIMSVFEEATGLLSLDLSSVSRNRIEIEQTLYDVATKAEEKLRFAHILRAETEADWRKYDNAMNRQLSRGGEWTLSVDHDSVEKQYGDMVEELEGYALDGKPCNDANKKEWVPLVPLWHKVLVMSEVFDRTTLKKN